jgi:hypothetical protein
VSPTPCRQFARAIRDLALRHPAGTSIWTGLWRSEVIDVLNTEATYGPSLSVDDVRALTKVTTEIGQLFCYATSAISNARQNTPMTTLHSQKLQTEFQEFQQYYPRIQPRCKLTPYRTKSRAERNLSNQRPTPLPNTRGLSRKQRNDRIRNHLAVHEGARAAQMLALAQQPTLTFQRTRPPPRPPRDPPNPKRLRHKCKPRRHPPARYRPQLEATPNCSTAVAGRPTAPPHIAQIFHRTQSVQLALLNPSRLSVPPRAGVG